MTIESWLKVLGFIGTGGWFVFQKFLKPKIKEAKELKAKYLEEDRKFKERVLYELTHEKNGSLKNAIKRIDTNVSRLTERQKIAMTMQGQAYWISDEHGRCIYADPNLCKMLKRSESEIITMNWLAGIVERDRERVKKEWMEAIENKSVFDCVYSWETDDGELKTWGLSFPEIVNDQQVGRLGKLEIVE